MSWTMRREMKLRCQLIGAWCRGGSGAEEWAQQAFIVPGPRGPPTSGRGSVTLCGRLGILSWTTVGHVLCLADVSAVIKMSLPVVTDLGGKKSLIKLFFCSMIVILLCSCQSVLFVKIAFGHFRIRTLFIWEPFADSLLSVLGSWRSRCDMLCVDDSLLPGYWL